MRYILCIIILILSHYLCENILPSYTEIYNCGFIDGCVFVTLSFIVIITDKND